MAYEFGTTKYLSLADPVDAYPFTMACWVNLTTIGTSSNIMWLSAGNTLTHSWGIAYNQSNTKLEGYCAAGGGFDVVISTANVSANVWQHCCFVCTSATSRTIYLNGGNSATSTVSRNPTAANITSLRIGWTGSPAPTIQGRGAEAGVWNAALTAAEVESLWKGFSPTLIQPGSLVFYAPLIRDIIDYAGSATITNNNTATPADHLPIYGL